MEKIPGMWRTELMHPLFVHFPIALLIIAAVVIFLYRLNLIPRWNSQLAFSTLILLIPGTILTWVSVYTGTLADNVVGREVCDPLVLEDHERFAYITAYIFTLVTLIEVALKWSNGFFSIRKKIKKLLSIVSLLLVLGGAASIAYVGHLGAKLVYQQAAAVHQPSEDCSEFE